MLEYLIFTGLVIIITAFMIRQKNKKLTKPIKEETNSKHNKPTKFSEDIAAMYKNYLDMKNDGNENNMELMDDYIEKQLDIMRGASPGIEALVDMLASASHLIVDTKKIADKYNQNI